MNDLYPVYWFGFEFKFERTKWVCVAHQCSTFDWRGRRRCRRCRQCAIRNRHTCDQTNSPIFSNWIWILKQEIHWYYLICKGFWKRMRGNRLLNHRKTESEESVRAWESEDGIEMPCQNNIRWMRFSDLLNKYTHTFALIFTSVWQCLSIFTLVYTCHWFNHSTWHTFNLSHANTIQYIFMYSLVVNLFA